MCNSRNEHRLLTYNTSAIQSLYHEIDNRVAYWANWASCEHFSLLYSSSQWILKCNPPKHWAIRSHHNWETWIYAHGMDESRSALCISIGISLVITISSGSWRIKSMRPLTRMDLEESSTLLSTTLSVLFNVLCVPWCTLKLCCTKVPWCQRWTRLLLAMRVMLSSIRVQSLGQLDGAFLHCWQEVLKGSNHWCRWIVTSVFVLRRRSFKWGVVCIALM